MAEGGGRKRIPSEAVLDLRRRLAALLPRHPDRPGLIAQAANLYGRSRATLYGRLQGALPSKSVRRMDRGQPRKIALSELERYCEIIAARKLRTRNQKDRHLSTARAIELLVVFSRKLLRAIGRFKFDTGTGGDITSICSLAFLIPIAGWSETTPKNGEPSYARPRVVEPC